MMSTTKDSACPGPNNRVSVISVTFNNASGLFATLSSLSALHHKPLEVIIIDGASQDSTRDVITQFSNNLPLVIICEPDEGIYFAMNKGRRLALGNWVHYLNSGDTVFGEPYMEIQGPCLLPVHILDENGSFIFNDFIKFGGYGYCHQGVIFPVQHPEYRTQFRIAADLDLIIAMFPKGLTALEKVSSGGIEFSMGGVSTRAVKIRNREARQVITSRLPKWQASYLLGTLSLKNLIPRRWRRAITSVLSGNFKSLV